ncbi:hypothetical protein MtrunA17_Chr4g0027901 [Medicago truncatula]|uniref:Uncharacterized protein n=1 Tax=Medicago truncatula TaxID=3880 RepID=A0A396I738_MEDTR|nr:hypothetical protein MtrunA17_Chr4g0027901 [Medicago truncatula]
MYQFLKLDDVALCWLIMLLFRLNAKILFGGFKQLLMVDNNPLQV